MPNPNQDAQSHYRTAGAVLQRMSPAQGVLTLRNATLKRVHPSVGGKQGAVLQTASSREQWLGLGLALTLSLSLTLTLTLTLSLTLTLTLTLALALALTLTLTR